MATVIQIDLLDQRLISLLQVRRPTNDDEFLSNIANLLDLTFLINKHCQSLSHLAPLLIPTTI